MRQIPLAIGIAEEPGFDGFLPGENRAALEHLRNLAPQSVPAYLWGAPGSGKTHLLRALASAWQARGARIGWFTPVTPEPWTFDEGWALIVLDNCEGLDASRQQAAFALFVQASAVGMPVVAAGRVPPVDLPLREDLRTRLGWGHVFALQAPSEPEVRAALRHAADRRGIFLSDDVMDYLLTRFARDLGHLMGLLDRLDTFALARKRPVTIPLLKQMLAEGDA